MLTLDQIRGKLEDRNLTEVSKRTDVSYNAIYRLVKEPSSNPSYATVKALSDYLVGEIAQ